MHLRPVGNYAQGLFSRIGPGVSLAASHDSGAYGRSTYTEVRDNKAGCLRDCQDLVKTDKFLKNCCCCVRALELCGKVELAALGCLRVCQALVKTGGF